MSTEAEKHEEFCEFIRQHQAPLRGFVRMLGVRTDSLDDVAQEAFMTAYREREVFNTGEDFGKWLRGIALNIVRNEARKRNRQSRILDESLTDHLLAMSEPDQTPTHFEDADFCALRDCLEALPEKSRALVSGRYGDEWSASILADQFQMSATAIRLPWRLPSNMINSAPQKRITGPRSMVK